MIVSIGMLAWNEEACVGKTIESLFQQSVFSRQLESNPVSEWELVVVPNGCTDQTAAAAERAIQQHRPAFPGLRVSCSVMPLEAAGKSNAWNHYVHSFCRKDASLIVMIDADIEFAHADTLLHSIQAICENPSADVVVDLPLKDIARKPQGTFFDQISLRASKIALEGPPGISGQFYCARAAVLRNIWMPAGLSCEDGFLRAMVVTDLFRSDVDEGRVIRAPHAAHWYETPPDLWGTFRHEVRLVIGTAQNCYLTWDFLRFATDPQGPGAGHLIKGMFQADADWYAKLIHNAVRNRGWWVLPKGMLFRRFFRFRGRSFGEWLKGMPLGLLSFFFDLPVFLVANRSLKKTGGVGYW